MFLGESNKTHRVLQLEYRMIAKYTIVLITAVVLVGLIAMDVYYISINNCIPAPLPNEPLDLRIISPENNQTYQTTEIKLNFTLNATSKNITCIIDNQRTIALQGNESISELSNGVHNLTVFASTLDNQTINKTVTFTIAHRTTTEEAINYFKSKGFSIKNSTNPSFATNVLDIGGKETLALYRKDSQPIRYLHM